MVAYVGLDPRKDIRWVTHPADESMRLLAEGKIDAFIGFPPDPQELRARKIGRVVVNSAHRPSVVAVLLLHAGGNREFVQQESGRHQARDARHPEGHRHLCAASPSGPRATRRQGLRATLRLSRCRCSRSFRTSAGATTTPEDTVRFYALRLHEAGMIKSSPQKIIAQGTDWRFLNELKKELKG